MCLSLVTFGLLMIIGGLLLVVACDRATIHDLKNRLDEVKFIEASGITGVYCGEME